MLSIAGFAGHMVSFPALQLSLCSRKIAMGSTRNKHVWLCSTKIFFTEIGRLDEAHRPGFRPLTLIKWQDYWILKWVSWDLSCISQCGHKWVSSLMYSFGKICRTNSLHTSLRKLNGIVWMNKIYSCEVLCKRSLFSGWVLLVAAGTVSRGAADSNSLTISLSCIRDFQNLWVWNSPINHQRTSLWDVVCTQRCSCAYGPILKPSNIKVGEIRDGPFCPVHNFRKII